MTALRKAIVTLEVVFDVTDKQTEGQMLDMAADLLKEIDVEPELRALGATCKISVLSSHVRTVSEG
ncbi:MAG: hypothetical protein ACRDOK_04520 [Streptosporangiaceae bacterium]